MTGHEDTLFPMINAPALAEADRMIDAVAAGEMGPEQAKLILRKSLFLAGDKE